MSHFEFIMVMLSIIVGLGVADLLNGVARQLRAGKDCKGYWVQSVLVVTILLAFLQLWWESWGLQSVHSWSFPAVLLFLVGPVGLYLVSHILFPRRLSGSDLRQHYFNVSRKAWGIAGLVVVAATVFRPVAFGDPLVQSDNLSAAVILAVIALLAYSTNRALHQWLAPLVLAAVVSDILIFSMSI